MFIIIKKNINTLILVIFLHISFVGLKSFISFDSEEYQKLSSKVSPELSINNTSLDRKLTKKKISDEIIEESDVINLATYNNTDFHTDYEYNEMDIDLTLVPINEKILFSGIPVPKSKPLPKISNYTKHLSLTVKSIKDLKRVVEDNSKDMYQYEKLLELISIDIDYSVKDNLKFSFSDINGNEELSEISIFKNNIHEVNARISPYGEILSQYVTAPTQRKIIRHKVTVHNTLSSSLSNLEIPKEITKSFINQFSFSVDFQRDINNGDLIEILFEADYTKNNNLVGIPKLLYASMSLKDHKIELFRYKLQNAKVDYFDPSGKSIRKSIMRTPISGARLSSRFGMRKHPILGYSKMHRGVDFAARRGTPIMAAGDGRVSFAGRNGSYGKFIEIRHLNGFSTRYGHLHKFSKKIKKGSIVKQGQIIGFVGNSGRSTGPHLHYEVKHKNRIINPMTLKLPSRMEIEQQEMPNFYANISLTRERLATTPISKTNRVVINN
jgi:murein DD-endopeptidase MepM/ murein hydrolase activator NlpD